MISINIIKHVHLVLADQLIACENVSGRLGHRQQFKFNPSRTVNLSCTCRCDGWYLAGLRGSSLRLTTKPGDPRQMVSCIMYSTTAGRVAPDSFRCDVSKRGWSLEVTDTKT